MGSGDKSACHLVCRLLQPYKHISLRCESLLRDPSFRRVLSALHAALLLRICVPQECKVYHAGKAALPTSQPTRSVF